MGNSSLNYGSVALGNTGATGPQGLDGLDGQKGATGAQGAAGANSNAGLSALGTFTGKNNGSLTAITMNAIAWDDGYSWSTGNTYVAIPVTGKYQMSVYVSVTGQSGGGNATWDVQRLDSSGTLIETLSAGATQFNTPDSGHAMVSANAGDRIALRTQNGATGSAGSVAGRFGIMRMS